MKQHKANSSEGEILDGFIECYYYGKCDLKPEANNIKPDGRNSLPVLLRDACKNYIIAKHYKTDLATLMDKVKYPDFQRDKFLACATNEAEWLKKCIDYINIAKGRELIINHASLTYKLDKCKEENEKLRKDKANLEKLNIELSKENARLHAFDPNYQSGKTEVGDVEKP